MCRPSDFPYNVEGFACCGYGGNHQIHYPPLVVKGYILPSVEITGNLADLFRADGFHGQVRYPFHKFLLAPVQFRYLHVHIGEQLIKSPSFPYCCCCFSSASTSGGIRSSTRWILCNSLSSFAHSIVSFNLPFSLAFARASNLRFSSSRSFIVTLYFLICPEKFSIWGNHFLSMARASSFFFPAFSGPILSNAFSMVLACFERLTACLKSRLGICLRPVLLALSPRSKSGYFSTM